MTIPAEKPKRRWLRFSIRKMLLLLVIVAIPLAWLRSEMDRIQKERQIAAELESLGCSVRFRRYSYIPEKLSPLIEVDCSYSQATDADLGRVAELSWLRFLTFGPQLGNAGLEKIAGLKQLRSLDLSGSRITDEGLKYLEGLTQLDSLDLANTRVSDAGLIHVGELYSLISLDLMNTEVSNSGLAYLKRLVKLQCLYLSGTAIDDAGLGQIGLHNEMQILNLSWTEVSDEGLSQLGNLTRCGFMTLRGTRVTDDGVRELRTALPNCRVRGVRELDEADCQQWLKTVPAVPTQEQLSAVAARLLELNHGFGQPEDVVSTRLIYGNLGYGFSGLMGGLIESSTPTVENGVITEVGICTDYVRDISPLVALTGLKKLRCSGSRAGIGKLYDLSPLEGMPLTVLHLENNPISDLTPLQKCPDLVSLQVKGTRITPASVAALQEALPNCKIEWDDPAGASGPAAASESK